MKALKKKEEILLEVLKAAEERDYSGYSKFDALNSSLLRTLSANNKWLRLILIQIVKESPINLRPVLRVEKSRNPKGISLFSRAYLFLYEATQNGEYLGQLYC